MSTKQECKDLVSDLFDAVEDAVDAALANPNRDGEGKVIPPKVKDLRDRLAEEFDVDPIFAYTMLSTYLDRREDVTVKLGRDGGIVPREGELARKQTANEKKVSRMQKAAERGAKALEKLQKLGLPVPSAAVVSAASNEPKA